MYKLNKLGIKKFSGMNFPSKIFWNIKKIVLINLKIKRVRLNVRKKKLNSNFEGWNYKR